MIDDVLPPFRPRCVMIQGTAQALAAESDAGVDVGVGVMIRITPGEGHVMGAGP